MSEFQQTAALQSIAKSLETLVSLLSAHCTCGHKETIHVPKCSEMKCKCERFVPPITGLLSILNQQVVQTADLKMVIATATGLVGDKPTHIELPHGIVRR